MTAGQSLPQAAVPRCLPPRVSDSLRPPTCAWETRQSRKLTLTLTLTWANGIITVRIWPTQLYVLKKLVQFIVAKVIIIMASVLVFVLLLHSLRPSQCGQFSENIRIGNNCFVFQSICLRSATNVKGPRHFRYLKIQTNNLLYKSKNVFK